ncbi:hypothetical protein GHU73_12285 [Citrobacter werkmanii]|nr:hypothetical protein [Citrobacter werkmanii]MBJ9598117.1 hypothetical protein [Citrobacter werkmanii]
MTSALLPAQHLRASRPDARAVDEPLSVRFNVAGSLPPGVGHHPYAGE